MNFEKGMKDVQWLAHNLRNRMEMAALLGANYEIGNITVTSRQNIGEINNIEKDPDPDKYIKLGEVLKAIETSEDPVGTEFNVRAYDLDGKLSEWWTLFKRKQVKRTE